MRRRSFEWIVGGRPPLLAQHSAAKLRVIQDYLHRYFDTVAPNPRQDRLSISLVDGFCGGGTYSSGGTTVDGSPLLLLRAVEEARTRLNIGRNKLLEIDATFYFVDNEPAAIDHLRRELIERGYRDSIGVNIHLFTNEFEDVSDRISSDILKRSKSGRSFFLLDQKGYTDVNLSTIRRILNELPKAEVILTFAVDWLINYMHEDAPFLKGLVPLEITEHDLRRYLESKGERGGRFLTQRLLLEHLKTKVRPPFYTPFFIKSSEANRNLWLVHFSKHATARNVMVESHWGVQNHSVHQGPGGLNILGFDPDWQDALPLDFTFDGNAAEMTAENLRMQLPSTLSATSPDSGMTFGAFNAFLANDTTAREVDIQRALKECAEDGLINILTPTGRQKQPEARLAPSDRLILPSQKTFLFKSK